MVDEKLIDELSHFHYLPMRSDINIINIYQQLSLKFSNYVPITKKLVDELHDELYDGLKKLDQKDIYYTDKKTIFEDDAIKSFVTKGSYSVISEQGYHEYLIINLQQIFLNHQQKMYLCQRYIAYLFQEHAFLS